jgi:alpha-acetolactate decarboxylase
VTVTADHCSNVGTQIEGVHDGDLTIVETRCLGNFGPGTFNTLASGTVILDGNHDLVTTNVSARILD